jgi:AcrR family transcriptional regulator
MARPAKPIITRERAAKIALDVIDANGLDRFGLPLVAQRMGINTSSLYHHFQDRDDVLAEVARYLLVNYPHPPITEDMDWKVALKSVCMSSFGTVLRHPNAAPLLLQFFPRHLYVDRYEYWASLLKANKVPEQYHLWILETSEKITFGSAVFVASARSRGVPPYPNVSSERHPSLKAAIRANTLVEEQMLEHALDVLFASISLDG